jgi:hypothetical protein
VTNKGKTMLDVAKLIVVLYIGFALFFLLMLEII